MTVPILDIPDIIRRWTAGDRVGAAGEIIAMILVVLALYGVLRAWRWQQRPRH